MFSRYRGLTHPVAVRLAQPVAWFAKASPEAAWNKRSQKKVKASEGFRRRPSSVTLLRRSKPMFTNPMDVGWR